MRSPLNDRITEIQPSGIRKFFDIVSEMEDAISLGVGEPDFDTPWHVREEGIHSLEMGRTFYTSNAGLKELRTEISNYINRRFGVSYDPLSECMVTIGGSEAIDLAMRCMLNPGDEVLIPQPSYVSYTPCAIMAGGVPVPIELEEKDEFRLPIAHRRHHRRHRTAGNRPQTLLQPLGNVNRIQVPLRLRHRRLPLLEITNDAIERYNAAGYQNIKAYPIIA